MRTSQHPAYIENYSPAHTEILNTMPNGTYAVFRRYDDTLSNDYVCVVSFNGRTKGFYYSELDNGKLYFPNSDGFSFREGSIFDLIGDGKLTINSIHFDASISVQLTKTLNEDLRENHFLAETLQQKLAQKELEASKQQEQLDNLPALTKNIISALEQDIYSGKHPHEDNEKMREAIEALKISGNSSNSCLDILSEKISCIKLIKNQEDKLVEITTKSMAHTRRVLLTNGLLYQQYEVVDLNYYKRIIKTNRELSSEEIAQLQEILTYFPHTFRIKDKWSKHFATFNAQNYYRYLVALAANSFDEPGYSMLGIVARYGYDIKALQSLIDMGADINTLDETGKPALYWAICNNISMCEKESYSAASVLKCLLDNGAQKNIIYQGLSLHGWAIFNGYTAAANIIKNHTGYLQSSLQSNLLQGFTGFDVVKYPLTEKEKSASRKQNPTFLNNINLNSLLTPLQSLLLEGFKSSSYISQETTHGNMITSDNFILSPKTFEKKIKYKIEGRRFNREEIISRLKSYNTSSYFSSSFFSQSQHNRIAASLLSILQDPEISNEDVIFHLRSVQESISCQYGLLQPNRSRLYSIIADSLKEISDISPTSIRHLCM